MCQHLSSADSTSVSNEVQTQTVTCRCCGQSIAVDPWDFRGKDMSLVTCLNPLCQLHGYTFARSDYADVDLNRYLNRKPRRKE